MPYFLLRNMELMKVSLIQGSYKDGGVGACEVLRTAVPAFLAPGTGFVEDIISRDPGVRGMVLR